VDDPGDGADEDEPGGDREQQAHAGVESELEGDQPLGRRQVAITDPKRGVHSDKLAEKWQLRIRKPEISLSDRG
jgi:hypothetical protein